MDINYDFNCYFSDHAINLVEWAFEEKSRIKSVKIFKAAARMEMAYRKASGIAMDATCITGRYWTRMGVSPHLIKESDKINPPPQGGGNANLPLERPRIPHDKFFLLLKAHQMGALTKEEYETALLKLVNGVREKEGLSPLESLWEIEI